MTHQSDYAEFLTGKSSPVLPTGIEPGAVNPQLYDFQRDIVKWALRRGRAAIFADCGMGKTPMQLEWARQIAKLGNVLIVCPLAVAAQTVEEGKKFEVEVKYKRYGSELEPGITITNYEMLEHFDPAAFTGVVLDESSILKHFEGKFRTRIIESFRQTPYKLAATATPAPNDHMELGNHAEFMGVMSRAEMLSMFFVHDGGRTSQWRVKGHAEKDFWRWVCSWAVMLRKPSDLGYEDGAFVLPPLNVEQLAVDVPGLEPAATLQERLIARRGSLSQRVQRCASLVNASAEQWVLWCNLNAEADELEKAISGAVQVTGSEKPEAKTDKARLFAEGKIRVLVTKPSIFGFGMNWQFCHNEAFVGLSDSWEDYYQAVRRVWRFGQKNPVQVYVITSTAEGAVVENIQRKEADAARMASEMINHMHDLNEKAIKSIRTKDPYRTDEAEGDKWWLCLGDCVEVARQLNDDSVDYSIFSPPFRSLYTYSASDRDMGNCKSKPEFAQHLAYLIKELFRVLKPGRNVSFHCMNLPKSKCRDGVIGLHDFRGELIRMFEAEGFIFHSEVCIWKNPVTAMQRTKALGLLHKQVVKDSTMSRQGVPDYLVTMRKPGQNAVPVKGCFNHYVGDLPEPEAAYTTDGDNRNGYSIGVWQRYASPVWTDINPSNTLQHRSAREHEDERHICPLQLDVIHRALVLWSNPEELVFSPFTGIGSEGYVALKQGRRFVGAELKESYFKQAKANLAAAEAEAQPKQGVAA